MIDSRHQQEHDDQDGAGLVMLEHAHGQLDLLPKPAGANQPENGRRADGAFPAVEAIGHQVSKHLG